MLQVATSEQYVPMNKFWLAMAEVIIRDGLFSAGSFGEGVSQWRPSESAGLKANMWHLRTVYSADPLGDRAPPMPSVI